MNILSDNSKTINKLSEECDDLEVKIAALQSAVDYGEKLLDRLLNPVVKNFIREWSESEMMRLSHLRMSLPLDSRDDHLAISVQYDSAKKFGEQSADIQNTVDENRRALNKAHEALVEKRSKLNKLKG